MSDANQQLGRAGEMAAAQYLVERGYELVEVNVRTRYGEIDLVMRDRSELVFVEVKTRRRVATGTPAEAVTTKKLAHTIAAAHTYIMDTSYTGAWRVDVIAATPAGIEHLENVTLEG